MIAMASSSSLSRLLHASPPGSQPQAQPELQHQPSPPQSHAQQQQLQPPSQLSGAGNEGSSLAPIIAPGYSYPHTRSSASPAASGKSASLATPATSPTATSAPASASGSTASRGHAANTSLYQCADCLKRYSRPEHLQRHIATHTLGKRFVCDVGTAQRHPEMTNFPANDEWRLRSVERLSGVLISSRDTGPTTTMTAMAPRGGASTRLLALVV